VRPAGDVAVSFGEPLAWLRKPEKRLLNRLPLVYAERQHLHSLVLHQDSTLQQPSTWYKGAAPIAAVPRCRRLGQLGPGPEVVQLGSVAIRADIERLRSESVGRAIRLRDQNRIAGLTVHQGYRRVQNLEVGPVGADHGSVVMACGNHDGGIDDIDRSRRSAKDSCGPCPGICQWFDEDVAGIEQPGQPGLSTVAPPRLAHHARRHNDIPLRSSRHLDDRYRVTVAPFHGDQRSGVEDQGQRRSANASRWRARSSSSSLGGPPVSSKISARTAARSSPSTRAHPASLSQALTDLAFPSATSWRARSATTGSRLTVTFETVILLSYYAPERVGASGQGSLAAAADSGGHDLNRRCIA